MPDNGNTYQCVPTESTQQSSEFELFRRGKEVLGPSAGGLITKIKKFKRGNVALARAIIEIASTKENPREYIGRILKGQGSDDLPEVVRAAIRDGLYYERLAMNRWKVSTTIYDERGNEVGF